MVKPLKLFDLARQVPTSPLYMFLAIPFQLYSCNPQTHLTKGVFQQFLDQRLASSWYFLICIRQTDQPCTCHYEASQAIGGANETWKERQDIFRFKCYDNSLILHVCHLLQIISYNFSTSSFERMPKKILILAVIIALCAIEALGGAPTANSPNNLYSKGGTYSLGISAYFGSTTTTLSPLNFQITLSQSQQTTDYRFGYAIQEINYLITGKILNISLFLASKTMTQVNLQLYANNANGINILRVNYLLIQPLFGTYTFLYHTLFAKRSLINGQYYEETIVQPQVFNTTGGLTVWSSIVGVDASLTNNQIDLYISVNAPNSASVAFRVSTISVKAFYLTSVVIGAYLFNANELSMGPRKASFSVTMLSSTTTLSSTASSIRTFNTLVGIQSYHITNKNYFQFAISINQASISISNNVSALYMQYDFLLTNFIACPSAEPYINIAANLCYSVCPSRTYTDDFYKQCNSCSNYDCYKCNSTQLCVECSLADNRQMNEDTARCVPLDGYYDAGSSVAQACNPSLCLTCSSATVCLSCADGKYLSATSTCNPCTTNCIKCTSGTSCDECQAGYTYTAGNNSCWLDCSIIQGCALCSFSTQLVCSSCIAGYSVSANKCLSTSCAEPNCASCSPSKCITCESGYVLTPTNQCSAFCGDGLIIDSEECDDGNKQNQDGCSASCIVEAGYICAGVPSSCSISSLIIYLSSLQKKKQSNSFTAVYKFEPGRNAAFKAIDWKSSFTQQSALNLSFITFEYDSYRGELAVTADYTQQLEQNQLKVAFLPPLGAPYDLLPKITVSSTLVSANNLKLGAYSTQVYSEAEFVYIISIVLAGTTLVQFLLGFYAGKVIAIELIFLYQLTFYSLATLSSITPTFEALTGLGLSKGYSLRVLSSEGEPSRQWRPLNFGVQLINNYNLVLGIILIPALGGTFVLLVNYMCCKGKQDGIALWSGKLLCEYTFFGVLFSLFTIVLSAGVAINFGSGNSKMISLVVGIGYVLLLIVYGIALLKSQDFMGQYRSSFIKDTKLGTYFFVYQLIQTLLQATALLLTFFEPHLSLVLVLRFIHLVVLIKVAPYKAGLVRAVLNDVITLVVLFAVLCFQYIEGSIPAYGEYAPFFILGLLAFALLYSSYYQIIAIVTKRSRNRILEEGGGIQPLAFSKRSLNKHSQKVEDSILNLSEQLQVESSNKPTSSTSKKQPRNLEDIESKEVEAHIENLNADFVINNPLVHAFRSGPRLSNTRKRRERGQSQLMGELMKLKNSLASLRGRRQREDSDLQ